MSAYTRICIHVHTFCSRKRAISTGGAPVASSRLCKWQAAVKPPREPVRAIVHAESRAQAHAQMPKHKHTDRTLFRKSRSLARRGPSCGTPGTGRAGGRGIVLVESLIHTRFPAGCVRTRALKSASGSANGLVPTHLHTPAPRPHAPFCAPSPCGWWRRRPPSCR